MFTGIVQATGRLLRSEDHGGDRRLMFAAGSLDLGDVAAGDSIAIGGACMTVIERDAGIFAVDVSAESLACTTLGTLEPGAPVNLEKALRLCDRLGGHLVSGHVDGIGRVVAITPDARSQRWRFEVPAALARYVAPKGSVCIDGVSLTVNEVEGATFGVNLIPHTVAVTTFAQRRVGDRVNIEVDLLARYLERLLDSGREDGIAGS